METEFWAALGGAVVGGLFTLIGSIWAVEHSDKKRRIAEGETERVRQRLEDTAKLYEAHEVACQMQYMLQFLQDDPRVVMSPKDKVEVAFLVVRYHSLIAQICVRLQMVNVHPENSNSVSDWEGCQIKLANYMNVIDP